MQRELSEESSEEDQAEETESDEESSGEQKESEGESQDSGEVEEKRRQQRIVYEDGCYVGYSEEKGLHEIMQKTRDLSQSGIAIEMSDPMEESAEVMIQLGEDDFTIQLKGEVRRREELNDGESYLLGIEFVEVSDEDMEKLDAIMEAY